MLHIWRQAWVAIKYRFQGSNAMTKLLEKAFEAATNLPHEQQDEFAAFVLDEISSEQRWDHAFAKSQDVLSALATEAVAVATGAEYDLPRHDES